MTFVGFLRFSITCFNVLAWPLFSLGYPLCASIKAIESNSNADILKLVTYWVSFSLISLFEHAFANVLHWFPFWPYMKLMAICWLMMPQFDGSVCVYKHYIHPCFSEAPKLVINQLSAWIMEFLVSKENFLVAAERYIEENGAEALEKLIASKSESMEPDVAQKETKIAEESEKKELSAAKWVNESEANLSQAANIKGVVAEAGKDHKLPEVPALRTVQNEWACALCQVTTPSEKIWNFHLQGKRHKANYDELKAKDEAAKNKGSSGSMTVNSDLPKVEPKKKFVSSTNQDNSEKREEKVESIGINKQISQLPKRSGIDIERPTITLRCRICDVTYTSVYDMVSHLNEKNHLDKMQVLTEPVGGGCV